MHILIKPEQTIAEVCDQFQKHFPFLKIEFYAAAHKKNEGSKPDKQYLHSLRLNEINSSFQSKEINIQPNMKVEEIENLFESNFGLHVQLFRLSGKTWLQTISTDQLTLSEQNQLAMEMSIPVKNENEPEDYHEQL